MRTPPSPSSCPATGWGPRLPLLLLVLGACSDAPEPPPPGRAAAPDSGGAETPVLEPRTDQRNLVFLGSAGDSLVAMPWLVTARTRTGGVERRVRGLLLWGEDWQVVMDTRWEDPPTPTPWRLLPHEGLRLVVGLDDALERLVYQDEIGGVELVLGEALTEWTGVRGGHYRLLEGSVLLADRTVEGLVLDMSRTLGPEDARYGDWAFLRSGDSLQVVLQTPERGAPGDGAWRGLARVNFRELRFPALTLEWSEVRAFEEARRDVPVAWTVTSPGEEVTGELTAAGTWVEAEAGEGAQLPLAGLFAVSGTLVVEGRELPVRGLLFHVQG